LKNHRDFIAIDMALLAELACRAAAPSAGGRLTFHLRIFGATDN
jgi:hypothetical protein